MQAEEVGLSKIVKVGNTSITVKVRCEAIRGTDPDLKVLVTEAQVVYVNIGEDRRPKTIIRRANALSG